MNRESLIFCVAALVVALAVCAAGFRLAALPRDVVDAAKRPAAPETLPDVDLGGGRTLSVIADHQGPQNVYVQSVTLNGAPHLVPWLTHAQLEAGGTLRFDLGPSPSSWGR